MKRGLYKVVLNDTDNRVLLGHLVRVENDGGDRLLGWWFKQPQTEVFVPLQSILLMEAE